MTRDVRRDLGKFRKAKEISGFSQPRRYVNLRMYVRSHEADSRPQQSTSVKSFYTTSSISQVSPVMEDDRPKVIDMSEVSDCPL